VTGDWRLVNLLVQRERKRHEDVSHSQSFAKRISSTGNFARSAFYSRKISELECGGAPPLFASNHCQEITSSEALKFVVP
jgi:hypothetical protein